MKLEPRSLLTRIAEVDDELRRLRAERVDVLVVVLDGDPGQPKLPKHWAGALAINNAKKAVVVAGKPRLVEVGAVRKAKQSAADRVWAAVMATPELAHAISTAAKLEVEIDSYWPKLRHLPRAEDLPMGDVAAPLKLTIDVREVGHLIDEDARVFEVRARNFLDRSRPRIELRVMPHLRDAPGQLLLGGP